MSAPPQLRRVDKLMSDERTLETLQRGFCGRLATMGEDGYPYCVPLLYVWMNGELYVHNTRARGHLRANVDRDPRVCFEMDEPGEVFPYGRFECDSTLAFRSVIVFGRVRVVEELETKQRFFEMLMSKYAKSDWAEGEGRTSQGIFPAHRPDHALRHHGRADDGKETPLPDISERWPATDRTKTPNARPGSN